MRLLMLDMYRSMRPELNSRRLSMRSLSCTT
jgi:hypothetical protein